MATGEEPVRKSARQGVAVIGAGMVAGTHLVALADLSDRLRITGVLAKSPESARRFARLAEEKTRKSIAIYGDIEAIAADGFVDWALVLTPPDARAEIVTALAQAGKPLLLEKPVERDLAAATAIVEACEAAGVALGIVFQHRTRAASRRLADMIEAGAFGPLALVEAAVPWWRDQSYYEAPGRGTYARDGGGVLINQAIHTLDLMMALAGPVSEVQAMAATTALHLMEAEDFVVSGLRFANGAVGSLVASTASYPGSAENLTFHFERAVARLASGVLAVNWRDGRTETHGETAPTGGGADPMAFPHEWHRDVIADFADAVASGRAPMVTGREALKVHALIDALTRSAREKRSVSVDYPEDFA